MTHFDHAKIAADLICLVKLLKKYQFESSNTMELYRIENIIGQKWQKKTNSEGEYEDSFLLNYDLTDVVFNITSSGMKSKPSAKAITVTFDSHYTLTKSMSAINDIFSSYNFQLYIKGYPDKDEKGKFSFFCWHLDRETNTDGNLVHPYYHFHAGGKKVDGYDLGDLFIISSPRIPHPPMDIFLSIHFIILNFLHSEDFKEQKKILKDFDYISIIERAQKRILEPYFSALNGGKHHDYGIHNLFPLFV